MLSLVTVKRRDVLSGYTTSVPEKKVGMYTQRQVSCVTSTGLGWPWTGDGEICHARVGNARLQFSF